MPVRLVPVPEDSASEPSPVPGPCPALAAFLLASCSSAVSSSQLGTLTGVRVFAAVDSPVEPDRGSWAVITGAGIATKSGSSTSVKALPRIPTWSSNAANAAAPRSAPPRP
eukprot:2835669-Prymnesium_polylepis.1